MNKWRIKRNPPFLGGWVSVNPVGERNHHASFADAVEWVDRKQRTVTMVVPPDATQPPSIRRVGGVHESVLLIPADNPYYTHLNSGGSYSTIPTRMLLELANACVTLWCQHTTNQPHTEVNDAF